MRLGRLPSKPDARTARMVDFVALSTLPASPPARDWTNRLPADLGMMRNDQVGDCAYASAAHMVQVWSSQRGQTVTIPDDDVVAAYSAGTGYDPRDPSTDKGASMLDVCKQWRTAGIGGHRIGAFVKVDPRDQEHVRAAVSLFGAVYVGCNLPLRAQDQRGALWEPLGTGGFDAAGSWGGHAVACAAYDHRGPQLLTWGARQAATWDWWAAYVDEAYACLSAEWVTGAAPAPSGVDVAGLQDYLARL